MSRLIGLATIGDAVERVQLAPIEVFRQIFSLNNIQLCLRFVHAITESEAGKLQGAGEILNERDPAKMASPRFLPTRHNADSLPVGRFYQLNPLNPNTEKLVSGEAFCF